MKNILFLRWLLISTLVISCSKKDNSSTPINQTKTNPFGIIVQDSSTMASNFFVTEGKNLGVPFIRQVIAIPDFNGIQKGSYLTAISNGFKVLLNINYLTTATNPNPFPTDLATYQSELRSILDVYKPELAVIENEEANTQYHSGTATQYLNELNAAVAVAHAKGYKITNGGLTHGVALLTWQNYINNGMTSQAQSFASRVFSASIISDLPALANHSDLIAVMKKADTLIQGYKNSSIDYVNFHWYEPSFLNGGANGTYYGNEAFGEMINYLTTATGKTVITNETGQYNLSPTIVTDLMQKGYDLKLPYFIWFDGDGNRALALHDNTGNLRPNGIAFKAFISTHY